MKSRLIQVFRCCCVFLCYAALVGMMGVTVSSCGSQKKSSSMKKIERESRKDYRSKEVKKAEKEQEKKQQEIAKEAEKARRDAITRHREFQTEEVRNRLDENLKKSNEKYSTKKKFFLVRWFTPVDDIEKIEKRRAKEVKQRMAATYKKAEKNNKERGISSIKTEKRRTSLPSPDDYQHGGGGSYSEGKATGRVSPSDYQHGGGGFYLEGKSKSSAGASDIQHGGGGDMSKNKTKKIKPSSEIGDTKGTSPRKNRYSKKAKPKAGE